MSKYVMVERDEVDSLLALLKSLPINALGSGSDGELNWPLRDEAIDRINHWMNKPAPASALFAEEMEDALIDMLATANERSITYGEGFSSCSDCKNADKLLVRIAAAKEGE